MKTLRVIVLFVKLALVVWCFEMLHERSKLQEQNARTLEQNARTLDAMEAKFVEIRRIQAENDRRIVEIRRIQAGWRQ